MCCENFWRWCVEHEWDWHGESEVTDHIYPGILGRCVLMIDLQILVNLSYGWDALDLAIRWKEIEAGVISYVLVYWSLYMSYFSTENQLGTMLLIKNVPDIQMTADYRRWDDLTFDFLGHLFVALLLQAVSSSQCLWDFLTLFRGGPVVTASSLFKTESCLETPDMYSKVMDPTLSASHLQGKLQLFYFLWIFWRTTHFSKWWPTQSCWL